MSWIKRRSRWLAAGALLVAAALLAALLLRLALARLAPAVADALGPRATVASIELGWSGVEVRGLVLRGDGRRWPAEHELRAERVTIRPSIASLWQRGWVLSSVRVDDGYLALLRTREGHLSVVPALTARAASAPARPGDAAATPLRIERLVLRGVALDLFDASVARGNPHRLRLTDLQADAGPIILPALDAPMALHIAARLKGPRQTGRIAIDGTLTPATRETDLKVQAQGLDLVALQPYIIKSGEASIAGGTLDLSMRAHAAQQRLHAPGRLVLNGLELQSGGGLLATFGGVPRQAVLAAMSRDGKIALDFTLEGRIDDPKFSINEVFATRFAVGLAEKLGVRIAGVVEGVGNVVRGLLGR